MIWRFRRSKTFGPLRLVLNRRGVGASIRFGPLCYSLGADVKARRTRRIPGTGVYDVEEVKSE
jgi:Protein of unknown function (DUF4236)